MFSYSLISLGCPKNLVDSETMAGRLLAVGAKQVSDDVACDVAILNTCGFLASARAEAREYLVDLIRRKRSGAVGKIIVAGCMVRHEGSGDQAAAIAAEFPDVDAWIGVFDEAGIVETAETLLQGAPPQVRLSDRTMMELDDRLRRPLTAPHFAYLKIADGCNRLCSFCAIPAIRGRFVSKPLEAVVDEAQRLVASGVKEISLIAQETTFYGTDLDGKSHLVELIERLEQIEELRWIRLMYTYPLPFDEALIDLFAAGGKLLPYIDIPLQHANDEILRRMRRGVTCIQMERLLGRLRERIDRLVLRTSLIVGFPGETEAMYRELVAFVKRWKFERAGLFPFSAESGTVAATLDDQLPNELIQRRFRKLQKIQDDLTQHYAAAQVGKIVDVIVDAPYHELNGTPVTGCFIGRTYADAPDVDPLVILTGDVNVGEIVPCEIVAATEGNLIAAPWR